MGVLANRPAGPDPLALAAFRGSLDFREVDEVRDIAAVDAALAEVNRWMVPLKDRDRRFDLIDPAAIAKAIEENEETRQMVEAVKMIGRKVRPDFSKEQASHWVAAVVASLTDLPPYVAVKACKAALHRPFEFPGQVEKGIREEAVAVDAQYRLARLRLENLRREIQRASQPKLAPPPGYEGGERPPLGADDYRRMAGTTFGRTLLSMGKTAGHISAEDYEAAMSAVATTEGDGHDEVAD